MITTAKNTKGKWNIVDKSVNSVTGQKKIKLLKGGFNTQEEAIHSIGIEPRATRRGEIFNG